jgi:hypothetical protein
LKQRGYWTYVIALAAAIVVLWPFRMFPILGGLYYLFLPTLVLVLVAVTAGAIAVSFWRGTFKTFIGIVAAVLALLTIWGLYLRNEGERLGGADVRLESAVERPVSAGLREAVLLDSETSIFYDRALFETVQPWCRESCVVFERIDTYRRVVFEEPKTLLEDIGVKPVKEGAARIEVRINTIDRGNRSEITAEVFESGTRTARLHAVVPAARRGWHSKLPKWAIFSLENNPLVKRLAPARKFLDRGMLESFLKSAIKLGEAPGAPVFELAVTVISSRSLTPKVMVDRSDPKFLTWWHLYEDPRCKGVISREHRPGIAESYVTFIASRKPAPQLLVRSETVVCAGDSVYLRVGGVLRNVLGLSRYSLAGEHTADLRIRMPDDAVTTFIGAELATLVETGGKIRFTVRNIRFESAEDAAGKPIRNADGETFEHAIIDRIGEYEVTLPSAALAAP